MHGGQALLCQCNMQNDAPAVLPILLLSNIRVQEDAGEKAADVTAVSEPAPLAPRRFPPAIWSSIRRRRARKNEWRIFLEHPTGQTLMQINVFKLYWVNKVNDVCSNSCSLWDKNKENCFKENLNHDSSDTPAGTFPKSVKFISCLQLGKSRKDKCSEWGGPFKERLGWLDEPSVTLQVDWADWATW